MKTLIFDLDGTLVDLARAKCFVDIKQLKMLALKYRFALVTGASRKETLGALQYFGLDNFFQAEFMITKNDVSAPKSTGAPFREIKKVLNSPAIFIGDSKNDLLGCARSDLFCVLVSRSRSIKKQQTNFKQALKKACRVLDFMSPRC